MHFHATLPITHRLVEKIVEDFVTASPRLLGRQVSLSEVMYEVAGPMGFGERLYDTNFFLMSPVQATAHLMVAKENLGLIELYRFANEPFTAAQKRMLSTLANQVALALRNAYAYRKTQELTLRDGLTGLYNHAAFQDFLEREFETFRRYNRPLSLIMADIDHFKAINDTYGHQTGDFILQELAALGLASVRKSDLLARYGGEEFALILPDTDLAQAQILAGRLWQKVQEYRFIQHEEAIPIAISLGVASTGTLDVTRKEELIRAADAALYRAKEAGRNRYVVAYGDQVFRCPQDDEPLRSAPAF
jgi:diguanylate cyclase (GGDEF)-like protein